MAWGIRRSRFGLQLLAIRDDEDRARGLGVRTGRVKLLAFIASAIPTGMAGAVYAYYLGQIFPQFAFDPLFDISIALMAFFGGLGTLTGPLARRAGPRVAPAGAHPEVLGRRPLPDRLRLALPRRDPLDAARRRADVANARAARPRSPLGRPVRPHPRPTAGDHRMTALLEIDEVEKSFGGLQALAGATSPSRRGRSPG